MIDTRAPRVLGDLDACEEEYRDEVASILELLAGMVPKAESSSSCEETALVPIDNRRDAQALLIDGPRGSGKSTLLLLLLRALQRQPRGIHPVVLIDLESVAPAVPLAAHVVASLRRLAGSRLYKQLLEKELEKELDEDAEQELERLWRNVHGGLARGWRSNLHERKGELDPAEFVWALESAAAETLDLKRDFRAYLKALRKGCKEPTLFVIAVDDADMHPDRVVELLSLVRVFWAPGLAFVATGDSELFLRGLQRDFEKRLREKRKPPGFGKAGRLAHDAFDKYFPPGHRFVRRGLPASKRWPALGKELKGFELSPEPELNWVFKVWPDLAEVIPEHHRQRGDFAALLAQFSPGKAVSIECFAEQAFDYATRRGDVPSEVARRMTAFERGESRGGDARLEYPVRSSEHGILWAKPEAAQVVFGPRVPEPELVTRPREREPERWPGPAEGDADERRGSAAFRLRVALSESTVASHAVAGAPGVVCAHVPMELLLLPGAPSEDWVLPLVERMDARALFTFSICAPHSSSRLAEVRALMIAMSGEGGRRALLERAAMPGPHDWSDEWRDVTRHDVTECFEIGLLATLPESGLSADDANSLWSELFSAAGAPSPSNRTRKFGQRREKRLSLPRDRAIQWLRAIDEEVGHNFWSVPHAWATSEKLTQNSVDVSNFRRSVPQTQHSVLRNSHWAGDGGSGLQKYFTDARVQEILTHPDQKYVPELKRALRDSPSGKGLLLKYLQDMWDAVRLGDGYGGLGLARLNPTAEIGYELSPGVNQHELEFHAIQEWPGPVMASPKETLYFLRIEHPDEVEELSPAQHVVLAVLRDVWWDSQDRFNDPEPERVLRRSGLAVRDKVGVLWPAPQFRAPIDDELFVEAWTRLTRRAPLFSDLVYFEGRRLDLFALDYIRRCLAILRERSRKEPELDGRPLSEQLGELSLDPLKNNGKMIGEKGQRSTLAAHFLNVGLRLLCFPEYGLSQLAADALWEALQSQRPMKKGERRRVARARLEQVAWPEDTADAKMALEAVDTEHAGWLSVKALQA